MLIHNRARGAKMLLVSVLVVICIAAVAGAVIYRAGGLQGGMEASVPAEQIKGSSFAAPAAVVATPQHAGVEASKAAASAPIKPATAADIPADIAKIPSATPVVTPVQIASVAGGSPPPAPPDNSPPVDPGGYKELGFGVLAGYKYIEPVPREGARPEEIEAERKKNQIPADVMALNNSKAVVEGWMVPMAVDDNGGVKTFVLVKTQPQCCFGDTQKMNEWIDVAMPEGKTAEFNVDRPIKVYGQLEVGEKIEDGFVLSIYRMKADKVSG